MLRIYIGEKMMPKKMVIFLLMLILMGGCIDMKNPAPKTDYYTFEYPPPESQHTMTTPYILKIDSFRVSPVYDDNRFLLRSEAYKRNQSIRHRWRANPGDLVAEYLARDFSRAAFLKAVITSESIPAYTHLLNGSVEEFYQRSENGKWQAVLSISIILIDDTLRTDENSILFQQQYSFHEPLSDQTPAGFAGGMSRAMQQFSEKLMEDVYQALIDTN